MSKEHDTKINQMVKDYMNNSKPINLCEAIVIPLRSRMSPMKAHFTLSSRNTGSGMDSRLTKTYKHQGKSIILTRKKSTITETKNEAATEFLTI